MNSRFDYTIMDAINNAIKSVKASPLVLGGVASSGGGVGGPVGGFVGQLPQTRSTYDFSEIGTDYTPESGRSLVDNLNHIRYRLDVIESGGGSISGLFTDLDDAPHTYSGSAGKAVIVNATEDGLEFGVAGVSVYESGILVINPAYELDFVGATVTASGSRAVITVSGMSATYDADRLLMTDTLGNVTTTDVLVWDSAYERLVFGIATTLSGVFPSYLPVTRGVYVLPKDAASQTTLSLLTNNGVASAAPYIAGYRSYGTPEAPETVASGGYLLSILGVGYDGDSWNGGASIIRMLYKATEDFTSTAHGTAFYLDGTPRGSTTRTNFGILDENGWNLPSGANYMVDGVPVGGAGGGGAFQRVLSANLVLASGESLVVADYIDSGVYDITLIGDAEIMILGGNEGLNRAGNDVSNATPSINCDIYDSYELTAQAVDISSVTITGTPVRNQSLLLVITGTAARAITWGASFEGDLPTTTVTTERMDVMLVWNAETSKWRGLTWSSA